MLWDLCCVPNLVQITVIVTEIDANMLQTFIWWRHAYLLPVSTFSHVVISASLWCIFPYNLMQDIFVQSKVIDIFPKFKMAADAILDFQFMWIWPLLRVDSVVFVFCTKFGSNICYSHWDRRTLASDLRLMTSCELSKKRKKDTPDSGKLAIRPDHPRRRIEVKVCMPGGLRCVVLYFKFY